MRKEVLKEKSGKEKAKNAFEVEASMELLDLAEMVQATNEACENHSNSASRTNLPTQTIQVDDHDEWLHNTPPSLPHLASSPGPLPPPRNPPYHSFSSPPGASPYAPGYGYPVPSPLASYPQPEYHYVNRSASSSVSSLFSPPSYAEVRVYLVCFIFRH